MSGVGTTLLPESLPWTDTGPGVCACPWEPPGRLREDLSLERGGVGHGGQPTGRPFGNLSLVVERPALFSFRSKTVFARPAWPVSPDPGNPLADPYRRVRVSLGDQMGLAECYLLPDV